MIIIEGPDNVGKTTAAVTLCKLLGHKESEGHLRHMTKPGPTWDYHNDFINMVRPDVVQDRFHVGGLVYGYLCGLHPTKIKPWRFRTLLQTLRRKGCFTVIMYQGNDANYAARMLKEQRDQMFAMPPNIAVNATYRCLARQGRWIDAPIADITHDVDNGFPTEAELQSWIQAYKESRTFRPS